MSITTVSSRDFARDLAQAKRATTAGPVFVTDRGKPTFALLKIEDYYKLSGEKSRSLLDVMDSLPGGDFEFQPPKLAVLGFKPAELD
jgi:PHD/YefM family antitoxin component YafN of YafNO toxin-antitoxin module